jgi:hypothetical protein
MLWTKLEEPEIVNELKDIPIDSFNLDAWHAYWMDEVDPRGSKRLSLEEFQMVGGGDY